MQGLSLKDSVKIKYEKEYLYDRLERLFFIRSELPGRMNDGSNIMNYFWQPADSITVSEIIFEVKRLMLQYEPALNVTAVSAGFLPVNGIELMLVIEVEYTLVNDPLDTEVLTFIKIRNNEE